MNIFEGSRRITKMLAGLWIFGFTIAAFNVDDTASVTYIVPTFNAAPVFSPDRVCSDDGYLDYSVPNAKTPEGTEANITLCFEANDGFEGGKRLIPYKIHPDTKLIWGGEKYSDVVNNYAKKYVGNFYLNSADYEKIDLAGKKRWWVQIKEGFSWMMGGLVFLFSLAHATGWIVRGFMGVPKGFDSKP